MRHNKHTASPLRKGIIPGAGGRATAVSFFPAESHPWLVGAGLFILTVAVFLPTLRCDFVNWDDQLYVYENPVVQSPLSVATVWRACTGTFVANWTPVTMLSYQLDAAVFGREPWAFHLSNTILHAFATALIYGALTAITGSRGRSAAAALLFGVHPLRVESVAWISERKDVLSVLFLAVVMLAYDWYCRRPCRGRFLTVVAAMIAGLMSKPMLVSLPVLLLLIDVWPMRRLRMAPERQATTGGGTDSRYPSRLWRQVMFEKAALSCVSAVFMLMVLVTQEKAMSPAGMHPFLTERVPNAMYSLVWYVQKTFMPVGLHAFHRHVGAEMTAGSSLLIAAALATVAVVAVKARQREPALLWGLSWYVVSLLPVLGLVQVGSQGLAERYTYVPHVGLIVAIVWCVADAANAYRVPRGVPAVACLVVASVLVALTVRQIGVWKNSLSLWRHSVSQDGSTAIPHFNLACALEAAGNAPMAFDEYQRALACDPCHVGALESLAAIYIERREFPKAKPLVEKALRVEPDVMTYINLAHIALEERRPLKAVQAAREAMSRGPDDATAAFTLGRAASANGDMALAAAAYQQAISLDPRHLPARNNLGNLFARQGRLEDGIAILRETLTIAPESVVTMRNLAQMLEQAGQRSDAVAVWRKILDQEPNDRQATARLQWMLSQAGESDSDRGRTPANSAERANITVGAPAE